MCIFLTSFSRLSKLSCGHTVQFFCDIAIQLHGTDFECVTCASDSMRATLLDLCVSALWRRRLCFLEIYSVSCGKTQPQSSSVPEQNPKTAFFWIRRVGLLEIGGFRVFWGGRLVEMFISF